MLTTTVIEGDLKEVLFWLERGSDVNERDYDGCTPLEMALRNEHYPIARLLIEFGAGCSKYEGSSLEEYYFQDLSDEARGLERNLTRKCIEEHISFLKPAKK